ncbi:MAG: sigma factor-like helix-turn-helix DNA-binding protein [Nitrospirota bacterium]
MLLEQAIQALPDTLREVLVLREVEGLECKEICTRVKSSWQRALSSSLFATAI